MSKLISLRQVLGDDFAKYIQEEIIPEIERGVSEGRITPEELEKIRHTVERDGFEGLDTKIRIMGDASSNNLEANGGLMEVTTELPGDSSVRTFFKQFAVEDFDRAVATQRSLREIVEDTPSEALIPSVKYVNGKRKILTMPFVEGKTLREELEDTEDEEEVLRSVIDEYHSLFNFLNNRKDQISAPDGFSRDYSEFMEEMVFKGFPRDDLENLKSLYEGNIAQHLRKASDRFVHGDLNTGSIIINGDHTFIDWSRSHKGGFFEYDLGQLLRTAQIDSETEERLVRYAAELFNPSSPEESIRLYHVNRVNEDLLASGRYLKRAASLERKSLADRIGRVLKGDFGEKINETAERLRRKAVYVHNTALRRISGRQDLFDEEFYVELSSSSNLDQVSDEEYEVLRQEFDSEIKTSMEEMQDSRALDPEENLRRINKKARRERWKPYIRKGVMGVVLAGVAAGALGLATLVYSKEFDDYKKELDRKQSIELEEYLYDANIKNAFTDYIKRIADPDSEAELITPEFLEATVSELMPEEDAKVLDFFASNAGLVRQISEIYRIGSGIANFRDAPALEGIHILDPNEYKPYGFGDRERFRRDVEKLASLVYDSQFETLEDVLIEFCMERPERGYTLGDVRGEVSREKAENYAANILTGHNYALDGGIGSKWLWHDTEQARDWLRKHHEGYKSPKERDAEKRAASIKDPRDRPIPSNYSPMLGDLDAIRKDW